MLIQDHVFWKNGNHKARGVSQQLFRFSISKFKLTTCVHFTFTTPWLSLVYPSTRMHVWPLSNGNIISLMSGGQKENPSTDWMQWLNV